MSLKDGDYTKTKKNEFEFQELSVEELNFIYFSEA
jgi:hypothetical protein